MSDDFPVNVRFNPDRSRWEALRDGEEVGFLDYQVNCRVVDLHTGSESDEPHGPVQVALIRAGLDQARDDGLRLRDTSPEVEDFLDRHGAEYGDLR